MIRVGRFSATLLLLLLVAAVCSCSSVMAATYHAAVNGTAGGDGSEGDPWDLPRANSSLQAGDTLIMHGGDYPAGDNIAPVNSGTPIAPIVYQAATGETPRIYRPEGRVYLGANLEYKSYITLDGITFQYCTYWIRGTESTGLRIENCDFIDSSQWESARFRAMGDYLYIGNCSFTNGTDNLTIQGGNYHLIEDNTFDTASHTLLVFMGVKHSVVRRNYFSNPIQKCQEVFSTREVHWPDPQRLSEYLVIEDNEYALAAGTYHNWAGIQYSGNRTIVRRNVFHDCGVPIDISVYGDDEEEAWYCEENRFYNNTLYDNGYLTDACAILIRWWSGVVAYGDNVFLNNIVSQNKCTIPEVNESDQVVFRWNVALPNENYFWNNLFFYNQTGQTLFGHMPTATSYTLAQFESTYSGMAADNMEADPKLVDPDNGNFTLQGTSPCIDASAALTHTTSSGSGTVIPVADALYFSDGKGIVDPDVIRIGGVQRTIVSVNYANNQITVSGSLSWASDDPVTLDYDGEGLDMGAFESLSGPQPPVAAFSGDPTAGPPPLTVDFTDLSAYIPTSWSWNFGDTGTSSAQHPSHQYTTEDTYTVSLTATNAQGQDTETKLGYIIVGFPDVPDDRWAHDEILACVNAGIVQGYEDGTYRPDLSVTRDQMAVYISRALAGGDAYVPTGPATATFDDVPTDHWAYRYVEYAVAHDVVRGYDDGFYHPVEEVDRGQMTVYVARAKGWVGIDDDMTTAPELFPDVPAGFWAGTAVQACVSNGVVYGYYDGYYRPQDVVTRDQMAVYISRAFELTL